jgi:hypothetical protein
MGKNYKIVKEIIAKKTRHKQKLKKSIGIPSAHNQLSNYTEKYSMNVLMANFSGESWGQALGGRRAFWNKNDRLILEINNSGSGLLLVEKNIDI